MNPTQTSNGNGSLTGKIIWWIVAALGGMVLFLAGVSTNAVLARVDTIERRVAQQETINRDREARLSRIEPSCQR